MFALVDCNNFYASCERVFKPHLQGVPIIVLSNNDGCIIARSNEAKAVGVPMGAPFYQVKALCKRKGVAVFSSNYQYYGDMSQRVMESLAMFEPDMEVYSIDEAFIRLTPISGKDWTSYGITIRESILQWLGMPVSIGIAPTKTLAKIANNYAKKQTAIGVFDMAELATQNRVLAQTKIGDVWGVGRKWSVKLEGFGITNALELRNANPRFIRTHFSVVGERMVRELRGISCLGLEEVQPKKNILSSKSFGKPVTTLLELQEAVSNHTARGCAKLREQQGRAKALQVFMHTNYHRKELPQYANSITIEFPEPTSDTGEIIMAACLGMKRIYKSGYSYKKCGVMLLGLQSYSQVQYDMFSKTNYPKSDALMDAMDGLSRRYGSNSVFYAAQGIERKWSMRSDSRSPRYTTAWGELPFV